MFSDIFQFVYTQQPNRTANTEHSNPHLSPSPSQYCQKVSEPFPKHAVELPCAWLQHTAGIQPGCERFLWVSQCSPKYTAWKGYLRCPCSLECIQKLPWPSPKAKKGGNEDFGYTEPTNTPSVSVSAVSRDKNHHCSCPLIKSMKVSLVICAYTVVRIPWTYSTQPVHQYLCWVQKSRGIDQTK